MNRPEPRGAALTGIGVRLPGPTGEPVRGPRQLWNTLLSGSSALGRYPQHRWEHMARRLHPDDRPQTPWPVAPLQLPDQVEHTAFHLSAAESQRLSATQRLVLEVGAEASRRNLSSKQTIHRRRRQTTQRTTKTTSTLTSLMYSQRKKR